MGGDVDSRLGGRSPPLSSLGKPYWRHHHMENGGFFGSCTLQEKESCINKYHLSCPNICVYKSILCAIDDDWLKPPLGEPSTLFSRRNLGFCPNQE